MDSDFIIKNDVAIKIYNILYDEYAESNINAWSKFIKSKDLGIISISYYDDLYKIIDQKKWALSKIKYGF
jgi:hypothetical protein